MGGIVTLPNFDDDVDVSPPKPVEPLFRLLDDIYDDKARTLRRVDQFLNDSFLKISSFDNIHAILWSPRGSEYFSHFLSNNDSLWENYDGDETVRIQASFKAISTANNIEELCILNIVDSNPEFCKKIIELFPSFLDSEMYKRWRRQETEDAMSVYENPHFQLMTTIPDILEVEESSKYKFVTAKATIGGTPDFSHVDDVQVIEGSVNQELSAEYESEQESSDICLGVPLNCDSSMYPASISAANSVLAVMDRVEIDDIMKCNSWFFTVLCAMEYAPVSFFVSSANPKRRGFPMVYANRQFEVTTGCKRREVIGRSTRYFSNSSSLDELRLAVQMGRISSAEFTDYTKNGDPFLTMLIVKPLYNMKGNYRYVLALQHRDVSATRFAKAFSLTRAWLEAIPESISMAEET